MSSSQDTPGVRLQLLVARIDDAIAQIPFAEHIAERVAGALQPFLGDPELLTVEQALADPARVRRHLLYVAPDGRYSILAVVRQPSQPTAIHDHAAWCVVGVHQGEEYAIRYRVMPTTEGDFLMPLGAEHHPAGSVMVIIPPEDIHHVWNRGQTCAISIHICGGNLTLAESCRRRRYELPIMPSLEDDARLV